MTRALSFALFAVAAGVLGLFLLRYDRPEANARPVVFEAGGARLSGSLYAPEGVESFPLAIFVHGKGKVNRLDWGRHTPLVEGLLRAGVGCFTWDKPGVGKSRGDYTEQSLTDRADEVVTGYRSALGLDGVDPARIGLIGFGEAGWVMPMAVEKLRDLALPREPAFIVAVSCPATTVAEQSKYFFANVLRDEGFAPHEIEEAVGFYDAVTENFKARAPYKSYRQISARHNARRWFEYIGVGDLTPQDYIRNMRDEALFLDAGELIKNYDSPVLAIWGGKDHHVDPERSAAAYERVLREEKKLGATIRMFPNADHALMSADTGSLKEMERRLSAVRYGVVRAEKYLAPGFVDTVADWLGDTVAR